MNRHTHRKFTTPSVTLVGIALVVALTVTPLAGAGADGPLDDSYDDLYGRCMSGAPRTADGHEGWSMSCHRKAADQMRLRDCFENGPRTADARDAWAIRCGE
ncbi:hypothetical protein ACFP3Q_04200 [Nocardioides sp. GCM10027113]|uniref:hypothetical protein n=1 Tax=unclassified Nocardioides TaxID=2615069 RepID=UPI00361DA914